MESVEQPNNNAWPFLNALVSGRKLSVRGKVDGVPVKSWGITDSESNKAVMLKPPRLL